MMNEGKLSAGPKEAQVVGVESVGVHGSAEPLKSGLSSMVNQFGQTKHPLEECVRPTPVSRLSGVHGIGMQTVRSSYGLHVPFKLAMEAQAASKIQRAPCLASSNIMAETLNGNDITLGVEDIYNSPHEFPEFVGEPHAIMEKRLGIF